MLVRTKRNKLEILVDRPLLRRVRDIALEADIPGFTLLPTVGGGGHHGRWSEEMVTGGAGSKVRFMTLIDDATVERLLEKLEPLISEYSLIVTIVQVEKITDDSNDV
ncbi:MAG: DUF3240 family protein [Pseudomonadota bacterium]